MKKLLFKLKNGDETTGFIEIKNAKIFVCSVINKNWGWFVSQSPWFPEGRTLLKFNISEDVVDEIVFNSIHPFVFKDRFGNKVFEEDKVYYGGNKAVVKSNNDDFGYFLEFLDFEETKEKQTIILHKEMSSVIKLVQDE
jgi:hypothetical protein